MKYLQLKEHPPKKIVSFKVKNRIIQKCKTYLKYKEKTFIIQGFYANENYVEKNHYQFVFARYLT